MISIFKTIIFCSSYLSADAITGYQLTTITLPKTQAQENEVHNWGKIEFNYTISGTSAESNHTNSNTNTNQQSNNQSQYNRQQNNQSADSGQTQFQEQRHSEYKNEQRKPVMHNDSGRSDFYNQTQSNYDNRYSNNISEQGQNNQNNQYTSNAQSNNDTNVRYDWTIKGYNATQWGTPPKESKSAEEIKIQKLTPIVIKEKEE
jgi:hypothetical protein